MRELLSWTSTSVAIFSGASWNVFKASGPVTPLTARSGCCAYGPRRFCMKVVLQMSGRAQGNPQEHCNQQEPGFLAGLLQETLHVQRHSL